MIPNYNTRMSPQELREYKKVNGYQVSEHESTDSDAEFQLKMDNLDKISDNAQPMKMKAPEPKKAHRTGRKVYRDEKDQTNNNNNKNAQDGQKVAVRKGNEKDKQQKTKEEIKQKPAKQKKEEEGKDQKTRNKPKNMKQFEEEKKIKGDNRVIE